MKAIHNALPALAVLFFLALFSPMAAAHTVPACEEGNGSAPEKNPHCGEHEHDSGSDDDTDDSGDSGGSDGDSGGGSGDSGNGSGGSDDSGDDNDGDSGGGSDNGSGDSGGNDSDGDNGSSGGSGDSGNGSYEEEIGAHTIQLNEHERRIDNLERDVESNRRGVALAIATASHQFEVGPDAPFQMSLAGGYFEGEEAFSIAAGGQVNDQLFISGNLGYTDHGHERGVGVSATWSFQ